jgi:tripartite-type tricarboxylate transporter receptor subunit TctC
VAYIGLPAATPFIKEGKLRALAVTSSKRSPIVPDVPTMAESGIKDQETELTIGLVTPASTPRAIVDLLSKEIARIVALPDVKEKLSAFGFSPVGSTPEDFATLIKEDIEKWEKTVREAGIKVQ